MTTLPPPGEKKLGLVVDLDSCIGCHACALNCKEWNEAGRLASLPERDPGDTSFASPAEGPWFMRVHSFEAGEGARAQVVHFPRTCLHCEIPACVEVCPTGAMFKRAEDGIVLVNPDYCIGCGLCSWACPYGACEIDNGTGTMRKCTLCIDRIYSETLDQDQRVPVCVASCPADALHFGDLGDPASAASALVSERGGVELMPEMGTAPVGRYLPPKA